MLDEDLEESSRPTVRKQSEQFAFFSADPGLGEMKKEGGELGLDFLRWTTAESGTRRVCPDPVRKTQWHCSTVQLYVAVIVTVWQA